MICEDQEFVCSILEDHMLLIVHIISLLQLPRSETGPKWGNKKLYIVHSSDLGVIGPALAQENR